MKSLIKFAIVAMALVVQGCSMMQVSSKVPGYLTNPKGQLLVNNDGRCWRTVEWKPSLAISQCDPDVVAMLEEEKKFEKEIVKAEKNKTNNNPEESPLIPAIASVDKKEKSLIMKKEVIFAPLVLNNDTSFRFGDDRLTPEGRDAVMEIAGTFKARRALDMKITVVGHTDRVGSDGANIDLSHRRAAAVKAALIAAGLPESSIEIGGMGARMPLTQKDDCPASLVKCELIECLRPDRRVEIRARGKVEDGYRSVPMTGSAEEVQEPLSKPTTLLKREPKVREWVCRA